jgi:hypothetical protein
MNLYEFMRNYGAKNYEKLKKLVYIKVFNVSELSFMQN